MGFSSNVILLFQNCSLLFWVVMDYGADFFFFADMYLNYQHFAFEIEGEVIKDRKQIQEHYVSG